MLCMIIQVVARIEGELLGANQVADYTTKKLLIPATRVHAYDQTEPTTVSLYISEAIPLYITHCFLHPLFSRVAVQMNGCWLMKAWWTFLVVFVIKLAALILL